MTEESYYPSPIKDPKKALEGGNINKNYLSDDQLPLDRPLDNTRVEPLATRRMWTP